MKHYHLNRRLFLRGLGGAVVAAPFLGSLAERSARAAGEAATVPKRLIVMFTHYGCMTDRWFPENAHGELTAEDFAGLTIESLGQFHKKLLMPRGLRAMNEWTAQMKTGQGNDPHTQVVGSFFSCQPVSPNSDEPFNLQHPGKFNAWPAGPSLDHICAKQLSPNGSPLFMRVGNRADNGQMAISYSEGSEAGRFPGVGTPKQAFSNLTGLFMDGTEPTTPDDYMSLRGKSIVDLIKSDLETLERMDMSRADKDKLAAWKELLYSTGGMVTPGAQCNEEQAIALGLTTENIDKASGGSLGGDVVTTKITDTMDTSDVYSAVAALSAACNANPIIFLKYPGNYRFTGLGCTDENHNISHRIGGPGMGGSCVDGVNQDIMAIDTFYAQKFAYLVGLLDSIPEGDGVSVLDNSATIWFQELSDGNAHNLNNMPIIQAGSCGGYFKTGYAVNLHDGMATLDRGNSEGPCRDQGSVTATNTGTNPSIGNAPINKYYCNIMNALGVKAGADGQPAEGGTAEVTHFGWSDKTEEFVHGTDAAAHTIHDPGAYEELKANA